MKNDYNVGLIKDGYSLDYEMETYLKIDVSGICA
jgi:hypothetical protein